MALLTLNNLYSRVTWDLGFGYISTSDYSTSNFLEDIDVIAKDYYAHYLKRNKGFSNWDIWDADTVALQDEYHMSPTSETVNPFVIEDVYITYWSDTYNETGNKQYIHCTLASEEQRINWEYYLENQPKTSPVYFERDGSIFIAPEARTSEAWVWRIRIKGIRSIASRWWTTSTTEIDVKLPQTALEVLVYWVVWKIAERKRRDENIIQARRATYIQERDESINLANPELPFYNEYP